MTNDFNNIVDRSFINYFPNYWKNTTDSEKDKFVKKDSDITPYSQDKYVKSLDSIPVNLIMDEADEIGLTQLPPKIGKNIRLDITKLPPSVEEDMLDIPTKLPPKVDKIGPFGPTKLPSKVEDMYINPRYL
ncbi:MAG: hypothetical protein ABDH21_00745 [bacterium]